MKKFLVLFTLVSISLPVNAVQLQQSQINQIQSGGSGSSKIYSSSGSLIEYRETQNNGTVKTYNKYHQATGVYKKQGSKIKYYPKK